MRTALVRSWFLTSSLVALALPAQERFTLEHTRRVVGVGSPALSSDGRTAAFVVSRPNYVANRTESQLWAVDLPAGTPRLLTPNRTSVLSSRSDRIWLIVEAGDVDWANHQNNIDNSIGAVLSGDEAFQAVATWIEKNMGWDKSVVLVTSDHGHYLVLDRPEGLIDAGRAAPAGK